MISPLDALESRASGASLTEARVNLEDSRCTGSKALLTWEFLLYSNTFFISETRTPSCFPQINLTKILPNPVRLTTPNNLNTTSTCSIQLSFINTSWYFTGRRDQLAISSGSSNNFLYRWEADINSNLQRQTIHKSILCGGNLINELRFRYLIFFHEFCLGLGIN